MSPALDMVAALGALGFALSLLASVALAVRAAVEVWRDRRDRRLAGERLAPLEPEFWAPVWEADWPET